MESRWFDGLTCSLKSCSSVVGADDHACVVATDETRLAKATEAERSGFLVSWRSGRCIFHGKCWETFRKATCKRREGAMRKSSEETVEFYEGLSELKKKAEEAARLLVPSPSKRSRTVVFTGAGISVASGIPDYRGTVGVDTKSALGQSEDQPTAGSSSTRNSKKRKLEEAEKEASEEEEISEDEGDVDYTKLQPTLTHRVLVQLQKLGIVHYIITQNCDNLHAKAGTPRDMLSELHGNVFIEYCEKCEMEYVRDYAVDEYSTECHKEKWYVKCPTCSWNHYTGRKCDKKGCRGKLRDTIVNFGDMLHDKICGGMVRAKEECEISEVVLALGSSLTVSPANELPEMTKTLIICNLQETELDGSASLRVFAETDKFMKLVHENVGKLTKLQALAVDQF